MRVDEPALSQAVLPSLAKAGTNEVEEPQRSARIGRARAGVRPRTLNERHRLYLLARLIVKRHYQEHLTLQVLAKALATCSRQIQRAYAQSGTSTFHQDLTERRMAAAVQLLSKPAAIPISDVASQVGYRQAAHFARAFRCRYGVSPARFRAERASARADDCRVVGAPTLSLPELEVALGQAKQNC